MEEASLSRYRRTLRPVERRALDELLDSAQHHLSSAAYAAHTLPIEIFMLAMLLEDHKMIRQLRAGIEHEKRRRKS